MYSRLLIIRNFGTERKRKLEFSGANAEGVYTQCEKKRKSMMKNLKINNPSEGGGNERDACDAHRTSLATTQKQGGGGGGCGSANNVSERDTFPTNVAFENFIRGKGRALFWLRELGAFGVAGRMTIFLDIYAEGVFLSLLYRALMGGVFVLFHTLDILA
ncbi:hypothetical protein TNCV_770241 [Trichonephila clavipes]|nr:hypothetical protein TNCV_770241 [Trichonephila clavipes]